MIICSTATCGQNYECPSFRHTKSFQRIRFFDSAPSKKNYVSIIALLWGTFERVEFASTTPLISHEFNISSNILYNILIVKWLILKMVRSRKVIKRDCRVYRLCYRLSNNWEKKLNQKNWEIFFNHSFFSWISHVQYLFWGEIRWNQNTLKRRLNLKNNLIKVIRKKFEKKFAVNPIL